MRYAKTNRAQALLYLINFSDLIHTLKREDEIISIEHLVINFSFSLAHNCMKPES